MPIRGPSNAKAVSRRSGSSSRRAPSPRRPPPIKRRARVPRAAGLAPPALRLRDAGQQCQSIDAELGEAAPLAEPTATGRVVTCDVKGRGTAEGVEHRDTLPQRRVG